MVLLLQLGLSVVLLLNFLAGVVFLALQHCKFPACLLAVVGPDSHGLIGSFLSFLFNWVLSLLSSLLLSAMAAAHVHSH